MFLAASLAFFVSAVFDGVGKNTFNNNYITCNEGQNINEKEKYYSELTFHYWYWKNLLKFKRDDEWVGFCSYREYWGNNKKIEDGNVYLGPVFIGSLENMLKQ